VVLCEYFCVRLSTFYVGSIDQFDPVPAKRELNKPLNYLSAFQPPTSALVGSPLYREDKLGFAIQAAAKDFRDQWQGNLGLVSEVQGKHYNSIKALSRRYAEGWDDGYVLRPTSNFLAALLAAISRFLEVPISWNGNPTAEQKARDY
jgi:hypothetical protein